MWLGLNYLFNSESCKNGVLNAAGVCGSCDSPSVAGPGQSHAGGPGKFDFYGSKGRRLAYYLFIFYVKFSAVWGIFELRFVIF